MVAPPPTAPAVLIDDLVEEFLLRLPPEDPAGLARAALVSRQWHRVITGPVFRRRFREFHRSPPLLGYIVNLRHSIRFVPMSSFRPPRVVRSDVRAIHSSHGRVLLRRSTAGDELQLDVLSVWDPITDQHRDLPDPPLTPGPLRCNWDAVVICAVGDGCNHLHCHFNVILQGRSEQRPFSCFYSSETDSWSDPIFAASKGDYPFFMTGRCVPVGSAIYMECSTRSYNGVFKYDMVTHQMSSFGIYFRGLLIATEDGKLGFAEIRNSTLRLWLSEHGTWEQDRAIELHTLLPDDALRLSHEAFRQPPGVAGFAETGAGVVFIRTCVGYFTIDLNSGRSKKVGEDLGRYVRIVPYVSFCTPAPGAVSTNEGLGDVVAVSTAEGLGEGVAISTYEGPGAGVTVSTDEGPGDGVAVSTTDEGPGAGVTVSTDEGPGAGVAVSINEGGLLIQEGNYK